MAATEIGRFTGSPDRPDAAGASAASRWRGRVAIIEADRTSLDEASRSDVDPVTALAELADQALHGLPAPCLADQLLAYVMPRPRSPETLKPAHIAPLLGLAADALSRRSAEASDVVHLGSLALEQELRQHQALAERRTNQIEG